MANYTSANHYVSALYRLALKNNLNADQLLVEADISKDIIGQPRARVLTEKVAAFQLLIWNALDDEHMGLTNNLCKIGTFRMFTTLAVHAPNLGKVFSRSTKYYEIVQDGYSLKLDIEGDNATFSITHHHPEMDPEHLMVDLVLLSWHRFCSWLINDNIVLTGANFSYPKPYFVDEYKYLFPCQHNFDSTTNSFTFNSSYLSRKVVQTYDSLKPFIANCPMNLFVKHINDDSLTTKVRQYLESEASEGLPDLVAAASHFHVTRQTLSLKLKAEGTSYQQVKNLVRRDIAIYQLVNNPRLHISDLAALVGFSEPGVFIRAFKGWTGLTPGDYRSKKNSPDTSS